MHSRSKDLFLEGLKGLLFLMNFLIKIDREFPTFTRAEGLKLGLYRPLSAFLMERSFHLFVNTSFLFWWFAFSFTSLTFAPHKFSLCHRKCVFTFFFWAGMTAINWKDYVLNQSGIWLFPCAQKIPFWLIVGDVLSNDFVVKDILSPFYILTINANCSSFQYTWH